MEVGGFANAFGNGLAFPFLFIYLHNVRGFPLPTVGLIAGTSAAVGIASIPTAGIIVDRIGGKPTLIGALFLLAVGFGAYALVHRPWQAFAAASIVGIGNGAFWPSQSALIIGLTPPARRHASFALQRVMRNFGLGLGGVAGGLIATTSNPMRRAYWTPRWPSPPTPKMATKSPARAGEFRSALNVVRPAHSSGAASADERSSGTAIRPLALAIITSA